MTAAEIGKELVALCRQGKNMDAIAKFYSPTVESVEAFANPQIGQVQKGIDAVKGKNQWWIDNHEVHKVEVNGPFPNGDQFIVHFTYDVTPKHTGQRMTMSEMGLYTVQNGKIAKETFFYTMCE
ncbi:MAG: nuclear transport factor 2 family protein [Nitrospirae bacterium]|nr:nuclear transport factor 2 family protein [Nitrospirota bacterium]